MTEQCLESKYLFYQFDDIDIFLFVGTNCPDEWIVAFMKKFE